MMKEVWTPGARPHNTRIKVKNTSTDGNLNASEIRNVLLNLVQKGKHHKQENLHNLWLDKR